MIYPKDGFRFDDVQVDDGTFMKVKCIVRDLSTSKVLLRGMLFQRLGSIRWSFRGDEKTNGKNGVFDKKANNICWIVRVNKDDNRVIEEQGLEEVDDTKFTGYREIRMSNRDMPWRNRVLECQWKYIRIYPKDDLEKRARPNAIEHAFVRLQTYECDLDQFARDEELRDLSRGETMLGGACFGIEKDEVKQLEEEKKKRELLSKFRTLGNRYDSAKERHLSSDTSFDKTSNTDENIESQNVSKEYSRRKRYTFGDAFCGAGATTRGAAMAGLSVRWGFDHDKNACDAWEMNFPYAVAHRLSAKDFGKRSDLDTKVDILHLSPPCQLFATAHTTQGKDDKANLATWLTLKYIIMKAKPRLVTIENVFGLLHPTKEEYMNPIVRSLTSMGFNVRWKVLRMADFGVPQKRKRVVFIASCPGERLPEFPKETHCQCPQTPDLRAHTTVNKAIANIPPGWANHVPCKTPTKRSNAKSARGDGMVNCILKTACPQTHPEGRDFTDRELAYLQCIPMEHVFSGGRPAVRAQIGNAVPTLFAKVLMDHLRRALEEADEVLEVKNENIEREEGRIVDSGVEIENVEAKAGFGDTERDEQKAETQDPDVQTEDKNAKVKDANLGVENGELIKKVEAKGPGFGHEKVEVERNDADVNIRNEVEISGTEDEDVSTTKDEGAKTEDDVVETECEDAKKIEKGAFATDEEAKSGDHQGKNKDDERKAKDGKGKIKVRKIKALRKAKPKAKKAKPNVNAVKTKKPSSTTLPKSTASLKRSRVSNKDILSSDNKRDMKKRKTEEARQKTIDRAALETINTVRKRKVQRIVLAVKGKIGRNAKRA